MHKCKRNYNKCRDRIVWLYRTVLSVCSSEAQFTTKHKSSAVGWSNKQIQNPKKKEKDRKKPEEPYGQGAQRKSESAYSEKVSFRLRGPAVQGTRRKAVRELKMHKKEPRIGAEGGGGKGKAGRSDYYRIITEIS